MQLDFGFNVSNKQFKPVSFAREGAKAFTARQGRRYDPEAVERTSMAGRGVEGYDRAQRYSQTPEFDPAAVPHFKAMRRDVGAQYDYATRPRTAGGLGIKHEVVTEDPYPSVQAMAHDVAVNRRMRTFSSAATGGHPFFTSEENDKFRMVHDLFGHAATGRDFSRHGEEAAYVSHAQMFSPEALPALQTETQGQNASLNYRQFSGPADFDVQRVGVMPQSKKTERRSDTFDPRQKLALSYESGKKGKR